MRWAVILLLLTGTAMAARPDPKALAQALMQPYGSEERIVHGPARSRPGRVSYSAPGLPPPTFHPQFLTDPVYSVDVDLGSIPTRPQREIEDDYFKGLEEDLPRRAPPKRKGSSR
jgi:hypothetical protein